MPANEPSPFGFAVDAIMAQKPPRARKAPPPNLFVGKHLFESLVKAAPEGTLRLRYLYDPRRPDLIEFALLGTIGGKKRGSANLNATQKDAAALEHFLAASCSTHSFRRLAEKELSRFLCPFPVKDAVEFTRQKVVLKIASWEIADSGAGFTPSANPKTKSESERPGGAGRDEDVCPFVLPFVQNEEGLPNFCEMLLRQDAPYLFDISFTPAQVSPNQVEEMERHIEMLENCLKGYPVVEAAREAEGHRLSTALTLRADCLCQWLVQLANQVQIPNNAAWVRFFLASSAPIPKILSAAAGQALTSPPAVRFQDGRREYLAGGYQAFRRSDCDAASKFLCRFDRAHHPGVPEPEGDFLRYLFPADEAAGMFRLPTPITDEEKAFFPGMDVTWAPRLEPVERLPGEGIRLGCARLRGTERAVLLSTEDHRHHVYAIGKTGVGKSSLLLKMAMENIRRGDGVAVVDPHGDLIQLLLDRIPSDRIGDVLLIDPSNGQNVPGLNLLDQTEGQRAFVVEEFLSMLHMLYAYIPEAMGPMFERNVRYGLLLLMADPEHPGTLVDFPHLFSDPQYHKRWLAKIEDPLVKRFWKQEFPNVNYKNENYMQYIVSKFDPFICSPMMRRMIGQRRSTIDFDRVINDGKILLVDLAKGKLTEINSRLMGMIVMAKLFSAALRRASVARSQRKDFYVYADEFQNLATPSFVGLLSEARKFRMNLVLCNQYTAQLPDEMIKALLGNVGTLVAFRVGVHDASMLEPYFAPVTGQGLCEQDNHHAYVRLLVGGKLTRPFSLQTELERDETGLREAIEANMPLYCSDVREVDADIAEALRLPEKGE